MTSNLRPGNKREFTRTTRKGRTVIDKLHAGLGILQTYKVHIWIRGDTINVTLDPNYSVDENDNALLRNLGWIDYTGDGYWWIFQAL